MKQNVLKVAALLLSMLSLQAASYSEPFIRFQELRRQQDALLAKHDPGLAKQLILHNSYPELPMCPLQPHSALHPHEIL